MHTTLFIGDKVTFIVICFHLLFAVCYFQEPFKQSYGIILKWFNGIYAISQNIRCMTYKVLCYLPKHMVYCHLHNLQSPMLFPETYDVLSSAWLAKSVSHKIQNKSYRKILNIKGPRIGPRGTPNKISFHELYVKLILFLCFLFIR